MRIEQIYTGCIAEAAYYIESRGEAAIIDPLRETQPYLDLAAEDNAKIKYVFETHFHADFVSGHIDLARKSGAEIVFGPTADPGYDVIVAKDEQVFEIGEIKIKVLHTPGHTMESATFLLYDKNGNEHAIFTGDTLFLGDVGRPDLAIKSDLTREDLAGYLYDSLRTKIMPLPDGLIVYPGHGAGSSCGKNMSKETVDTLGNQRKTNYALRSDMTKEEFVEEVLTGILPPPKYFPLNAMMNKNGYESYDDVITRGNIALNVDEAKELYAEGDYMILDCRHEMEYGKGHIPGSRFIGLDGNFAMWVGTLIEDLKQKIILIAPDGREIEALTRLSRVGYDNTRGFLKGGFNTWFENGEAIETERQISAQMYAKFHREKEITTLDVRKPSEFDAEHVVDATLFPVDYIFDNLESLDKDKTYYLHCAGGYRSMSAISILKTKGYKNLVNINGGFDAIRLTDVPVTEYVCPTTL
ncbi:MAG: MBL fold metallo-hydrolase [Bacteroidetes bacterium]|nr:MAG: MBL fold metallo-hydrolase [Bacteroidota bacterium]